MNFVRHKHTCDYNPTVIWQKPAEHVNFFNRKGRFTLLYNENLTLKKNKLTFCFCMITVVIPYTSTSTKYTHQGKSLSTGHTNRSPRGICLFVQFWVIFLGVRTVSNCTCLSFGVWRTSIRPTQHAMNWDHMKWIYTYEVHKGLSNIANESTALLIQSWHHQSQIAHSSYHHHTKPHSQALLTTWQCRQQIDHDSWSLVPPSNYLGWSMPSCVSRAECVFRKTT